MIGTTPKQAQCLDFMKAFIAKHGVPPTYRQIAENAGLESHSGVHRLIVGLEHRNLIRRIPGRARAIEIVEPDAIHPLLTGLAPNVREAVFKFAQRHNILPEMVVADIVKQWAANRTVNGNFT